MDVVMRYSRPGRLARLALASCAIAAPPLSGKTGTARAQPSGIERTFTLEEAQRLALLNSAALLSAEQNVFIAQQRVQEAKFLFFPEVGLQASGTRYESRYPFALAPELHSILLFPSDRNYIYSGRAYLTQTLYDGRKTINLFRLAQSALKQAQTQYEAVRLDTAHGTRRAFFQLLHAQERLAAAEQRLRAVQTRLSRDFSGWERVEAEAWVAQLRSREAEALHAAELELLEFRKTLNLELDTPVRVLGTLETQPVTTDLHKLLIWAMEMRPELQSEIYKAKMEDIAVNLASGRRFPTIILASNYEITDNRFPIKQNNWDATLGLRIPFPFDFWTQIRQKRAEKRQGEILRADSQDRVRLEVRKAYEDLQFWQTEWPLREKEYLRIKELAQSAGERGGPAAIRAQPAYLDAQERYLGAVMEHLVAVSKLERAVGRRLGPEY
ncbi:MAG: TolC family protein [Elusimicrobia bacterium]|nr:TolC family protein [Elusimicrobiota bacterium]